VTNHKPDIFQLQEEKKKILNYHSFLWGDDLGVLCLSLPFSGSIFMIFVSCDGT